MEKLKLKKQTTNELDFGELGEMIFNLKEFSAQKADFTDAEWTENLNTILDFQDADGSFKLLEGQKIPIEAKVDFHYTPTYICTAILMNAFLSNPSHFTAKHKNALKTGLRFSCAKNLAGHGFEALKGQIEALNIFMDAGLNEFTDIHANLCPEFSVMIENIKAKFQDMENEGKFKGPWGESYKEDILAINEYFCQRLVFVYGTLMKGEANQHYLENSKYVATATIKGYDMYNVGWYPAITPGEGIVIGELYQVPIKDLPAIDMLEGEGTLYAKTCETVNLADGNSTMALVYVYLGNVDGLESISAWKKDYVWYVSYGSNMLNERFMCYIKGGAYDESRYHPPCGDTTPPVAVMPVDIPYDMYFGNVSGSWNGSGVSFLDITQEGFAHGVAYLITKEQFDHVVFEENSGRYQREGWGWYEDTIDLETIDGFEVKTITNRNLRDHTKPFDPYLEVLHIRFKENHPHLSDV